VAEEVKERTLLRCKVHFWLIWHTNYLNLSTFAKVVARSLQPRFCGSLCIVCSLSISLSLRFNGHFPGEPGLAGFLEAKGDGSGGDNWSYKLCKAPVYQLPPRALATSTIMWVRSKFHPFWAVVNKSNAG